jgi:hypothetical protein
MAVESRLQWMGYWAAGVGIIWLALFAKELASPSETDPTNRVIAYSAIPAVVLWPWGASLGFFSRYSSRQQFRAIARSMRWAYTIGCIVCMLHVVTAFHLGHGWSHQAAYEHTERASGYGWGIFVNYLFVAVWIAEMAWSWVDLDCYLNRPPWVSWLVIGFMGFVIFNAAVVFGSGAIRWASLFVLTVPFSLLFWHKQSAAYLQRFRSRGTIW